MLNNFKKNREMPWQVGMRPWAPNNYPLEKKELQTNYRRSPLVIILSFYFAVSRNHFKTEKIDMTSEHVRSDSDFSSVASFEHSPLVTKKHTPYCLNMFIFGWVRILGSLYFFLVSLQISYLFGLYYHTNYCHIYEFWIVIFSCVILQIFTLFNISIKIKN